MDDVSYVFNKEVLDGGSLGLLDDLLDGLVYVVNKLVLSFDALDYPIIHFVGQDVEDGEVLEVHLRHLGTNVLHLLLYSQRGRLH